MKKGFLSQYFKGVIVKKLSAVETDPSKSNQHEYNGTKDIKGLFGDQKRTFEANFIYLTDDGEKVAEDGFLTWYDARANHPTRSEFRLFYSSTVVATQSQKDDLLFICLKQDDSVLVVIAEHDSTIAAQLCWLFSIEAHDKFSVSKQFDENRIEYASNCILEQLGIEIENEELNYLDDMISRFPQFPKTSVFSEYARQTISQLDPRIDSADSVLMAWMNREESLFRTLEKYFIEKQLSKGFADVDEFIKYSLSVQNRRKSRVGYALENHFEVILQARGLKYTRTPVTENKSKPDFIFPSIEDYKNLDFPTERLTMLGAKSTCKDRWRQVLEEADRIANKHLLTLQPSISVNQTNEMQSKKLQLVIPAEIQKTYTIDQQRWLMTVDEFLNLVKSRE